MIDLKNLELTKWKRAAGAAANTGAVGAVAQSEQRIIADLCSIWSVAPDQAKPDDGANIYAFQELGKQNDLTKFKLATDLWIDKAAENLPNCLEFEFRQDDNGMIFDMAWQLRWSDKSIRTFNYAAGTAVNGAPIGDPWEPTGKTFALPGGAWHNLVMLAHRTPALDTVVDSIEIDGQVLPLNVVRRAVNISDAMLASGKYGDKLNVAFQFDMRPRTPFSILTRNMSVTCE